MNMKCLVKESLNVDGLVLKQDVHVPKVKEDEVLIKVQATCVCGTDKSIYLSSRSEGIQKEMRRYITNGDFKPLVIGHEFCGTVEALGPGIEEKYKEIADEHKVQVGDYVTAEMHLSCGHCLQCRTGDEHICTKVKVKGVHLDGCFAQYVCVPYKNVILLGKDGDTSKIPTKIGSMLDAFGNAVHTVYEADVRGKSVAILGAGPLGLMAAMLCKEFGAARIYLTEAVDTQRRFELAGHFGVDFCFDVAKGSKEFISTVEKYESFANGVDVVLEMSGAPSAYEDAFAVVKNGGEVLLLGITRTPLKDFDIAGSVIWKGVNVKGIFGRKMFGTWETMLRLLKSDRLDIQSKLLKIITDKTYPLEQFEEAFSLLNGGKEMKLVFELN